MRTVDVVDSERVSGFRGLTGFFGWGRAGVGGENVRTRLEVERFVGDGALRFSGAFTAFRMTARTNNGENEPIALRTNNGKIMRSQNGRGGKRDKQRRRLFGWTGCG
jgi:hypothetical protein